MQPGEGTNIHTLRINNIIVTSQLGYGIAGINKTRDPDSIDAFTYSPRQLLNMPQFSTISSSLPLDPLKLGATYRQVRVTRLKDKANGMLIQVLVLNVKNGTLLCLRIAINLNDFAE